mgnify:CR=1 FL=1
MDDSKTHRMNHTKTNRLETTICLATFMTSLVVVRRMEEADWTRLRNDERALTAVIEFLSAFTLFLMILTAFMSLAQLEMGSNRLTRLIKQLFPVLIDSRAVLAGLYQAMEERVLTTLTQQRIGTSNPLVLWRRVVFRLD